MIIWGSLEVDRRCCTILGAARQRVREIKSEGVSRVREGVSDS